MQNGSLLEVRDLRTQFRTDDGIVHAVNGVSFAVNEGETVGIVGESGCGKTVTALSILRLIPQPPGEIVSGQVLFQGRDLLLVGNQEICEVRGNRIGMIFQDPMTFLNPVLTIGRQVAEALEVHLELDSRSARERVIELLQLVGIPRAEERMDDYPHAFSGGMRQRAMIAMAVSCRPQLLIADEPTTALDVTIQAQIIDLVKGLSRETGLAVLWITHDLGIIAGLADRVLVMYAGYIVESALVKDLYTTPRHPYTLGLLGSVPRVDQDKKSALTPIAGIPPDLIDLPTGCPFHPRCLYATGRCSQTNPELRKVAEEHMVACWVDLPQMSVATTQMRGLEWARGYA